MTTRHSRAFPSLLVSNLRVWNYIWTSCIISGAIKNLSSSDLWLCRLRGCARVLSWQKVDPGWPVLCINLTRFQDAQMIGEAFIMSVCIWEETSREISVVIGIGWEESLLPPCVAAIQADEGMTRAWRRICSVSLSWDTTFCPQPMKLLLAGDGPLALNVDANHWPPLSSGFWSMSQWHHWLSGVSNSQGAHCGTSRPP